MLASLRSHASAATSALGSLEHLGTFVASEGSTPRNDFTLQTAVKEMAHTLQTDSTPVSVNSRWGQMVESPTCCAGASAGKLTGHYRIAETLVQDVQDLPDLCPLDEGDVALQGGRAIGSPSEHAQEIESAPQPALIATALQQVLTSGAGQSEALPEAASSSVCASQSGKAAGPAVHTSADCALPASEEHVACAVEADPADYNDQLAAETPSNAAHYGVEPHVSISKQSSDASSTPAAHLRLLQTSEDPPEGVNPTLDPSIPTAADCFRAGSDLLQQQICLESVHTPGRPAAIGTAEAVALQRSSSEEADHMLSQTLSQTDAVPSLTPLSTTEHAAVTKQTAAVDLLGDTASPQVAASDLCTNSAPSQSIAMLVKVTANPSQPNQASLQLWSLPLTTPTQLPPPLRSFKTAAPLHRAVSESALLSDFASESLDTPAKPKRRSLLSHLRPSRGSKGGSDLGRTASDPALLMRQSSADPETLKSPTKRLSLSALLRRGSRGNSTTVVIDPAAVASGGSIAAATAAGASTDVVGSLASLSSTITTAGLDQMQSSSQPQVAKPRLVRAISSGNSSAQDQGWQPQSAPASPRGRGGTAPPKGNVAQPDLTLDRAVSDPSMLARLSSGRHSISTTPRRMSLLGRLSRGRRSNSIMPEPSSGPMPGQLDPAQEATAEEVPFAEQPFAEQPLAEQPSAQQPPVEQPSVEQPSVKQPTAEQPFVEASIEQLSAEQAIAKQPLAEQPSVEQPLAEQALDVTSLPEGAHTGQQLLEEQHLPDLAEPQDVAGESETLPQNTKFCSISG